MASASKEDRKSFSAHATHGCDDFSAMEDIKSRLTRQLRVIQAEQAAMKTDVELLLMKKVELGGLKDKMLGSEGASVRNPGSIGFMVSFKEDNVTISVGQTLTFDHVYVNAGHGFNSQTGCFTVARGGFYVFFFKTEVESQETISFDLYKNDLSVARISAAKNPETVRTINDLAVLQLNFLDKVKLVKTEGEECSLKGGHATRFSGFLLPSVNGSSPTAAPSTQLSGGRCKRKKCPRDEMSGGHYFPG